MGDAATLDTAEVVQEDILRARVYDLLGKLLRDAPSVDFLSTLSGLKGDETPLGGAIGALAKVAKSTGPEKASREFHDLFVGLGRGELLPYASYYMTGFLNEKPLAKLRNDMARLMIERAPSVYEPEDNIGSLCEMMAGLILGRFGSPADLSTQKDFFATHISPWAGHFFADLEGAEYSLLYAPVGTVGARFIEIEKEAFRMTE
jgi:TorA maturation chaperone TorD